MRKAGESFLLLDGGDFIKRDPQHDVLESRLVWRDMERLHYDAVALGEMEYGQWDLVRDLMEKSPIPIVSTNVEQLKDGEWLPIGSKSLVVVSGGVRIGILSVIEEKQLSAKILEDAAGNIRMLPGLEEVQKELKNVRKRADVVVLLAHLDPQALEQFATVLEGVDVVLGGHMTPKDEGPVQIANVVVNRSGTRGQTVCSTQLIISPRGDLVDFGGSNVTLTKDFREDPDVLAEVTKIKEEAAALRKEKGRLAREEAQKKAAERGQTPRPEPPQAGEQPGQSAVQAAPPVTPQQIPAPSQTQTDRTKE